MAGRRALWNVLMTSVSVSMAIGQWTHGQRRPCDGHDSKYVCKPGDPGSFYLCSHSVPYEFDCPQGLLFNQRHSTCDWPRNSDCGIVKNIPVSHSASHPGPTVLRRARIVLPHTNNHNTNRSNYSHNIKGTIAGWKDESRDNWKIELSSISDNGFRKNIFHDYVDKSDRNKYSKTAPWFKQQNKWVGIPKKQDAHSHWGYNLSRKKDKAILTGVTSTWAIKSPLAQPSTTASWTKNTVEKRWWPLNTIPTTSPEAANNGHMHRQPKSKLRTSVDTAKQYWVDLIGTSKPAWVPARVQQLREKHRQFKRVLSGPCDPETCRLPSCRCPGTSIPDNILPSDTPMMVMVSFDDEVNQNNMHYFDDLFDSTLRNPNHCPIKCTFFASEVASNFENIRQLYDRGHEIGSHSRSHRYPASWWGTASYDDYEREIKGMRNELVRKAGIPIEKIVGMRAPFLQIGGDNQFGMLADNNFLYDSSFITGDLYKSERPPLWPFTMDYPVDWKVCSLEPRPQKSYPGLWEIPLVRLYGNDARACAMADSCSPTTSPGMALQFLRENFSRHYKSNRAPFGIFVHARWFSRDPNAFKALHYFIRELSQMDDVWLVSLSQVIRWMQRPVPISRLKVDDVFRCT